MAYQQYNLNSNRGKWLLLVLFIAVSIAINLYFRLQTFNLGNLRLKAEQSVYSEVRYNLQTQNPANPYGLSKKYLKESIDKIEDDYIAKNHDKIDLKIEAKIKRLRDYYQDNAGWTYLLEIDPYRWQRRVESLLATGHFGTSRVNGKEYDMLMSGSTGEPVEPIKLHFLIGASLYKFLHHINNNLSVTNCISMQPILLLPLLIIAIFWLSSVMGISTLGSFIASITIGLSSIFIIRSSFGWFDTDIYNMILPVLIFSSLGYSFKRDKPFDYLFIIIAGALIGIYSLLWQVWWLIFYLAAFCITIYALSEIILKRNAKLSTKIRKYIKLPLIFIGSSYLSVMALGGFQTLKKSFLDTLWYLSMRTSLTIDNFWPNTTVTIAELHRSNAHDIYSNLGGPFVFFASLLGIASVIVSSKSRQRAKNKKFPVLSLIIWYSVALLLTQFGRRFILFLVVPAGIAVGILWDFSYDICTRARFKNISLKLNRVFSSVALTIIALTMIFVPISSASQLNVLPFFNRSWDTMLSWVSANTPTNAIINSWWDYGDYIMTASHRASITDANWPSTPKTYWMAKALTSQDETESLGILRMLDSGANQAFEKLLPIMNNDRQKTVSLLNKLILLNRESGQKLLAQYTTNLSQKEILDVLYNPRPGYLLLSDEMLNYFHAMGIIGSWDFKKLGLWQNFIRNRSKNRFYESIRKQYDYTNAQADEIFDTLSRINRDNVIYWISQGNFKFYTNFSDAIPMPDKNKAFFNNGIIFDTKNTCGYFFNKRTNRWVTPVTTIIYNKELQRIQEVINKDGDLAYTVFISQEGQSYRAMVVSTPTAKSLFFRLFFTDGAGLKYFKLLHNEEKDGFTNLYLYKIDWEI